MVALIEPHDWQQPTRLLVAWNCGVILYLVVRDRMMMHADNLSIRRRAQLTDDGKYAFLKLSIVAAIASFAAIVFELSGAKDLTSSDKAAHTALVATTIVSSWFFVHLIFTLHYAHEYVADELRTPDPTDVRGGLIFPGTKDPHYLDFLFFPKSSVLLRRPQMSPRPRIRCMRSRWCTASSRFSSLRRFWR